MSYTQVTKTWLCLQEASRLVAEIHREVNNHCTDRLLPTGVGLWGLGVRKSCQRQWSLSQRLCAGKVGAGHFQQRKKHGVLREVKVPFGLMCMAHGR